MGKAARLAGIYPFKLCAAILKGFSNQLTKDGIIQPGCVGLHVVEESNDVPLMLMGSSETDDRICSRGGCSAVTGMDKEVLSMSGKNGVGKPYT